MEKDLQIRNLRLSQKNTLIKLGGISGIVLASILFVVMILLVVILALACTLLNKASGATNSLNDIIDLGQIGKTINGGVEGVSKTVKSLYNVAIAFVIIEVIGLVLCILMLSINRLHPVVQLIFAIIIFLTDPIAGIFLLIGTIISFVQHHKIITDNKMVAE